MMPREAGFTLVELLAATVIVAMIAALGAGGLRFGLRAWERVEAASEAEIEARALRRFLTALFEGVAPIRLRDGSREPPALFFGEERRLLALTELPGRLAPPGPHLVLLEATREGSGYDLVVRWRPIGVERPRLDFDANAPREVLVEGLEAVAFRYSGPRGAVSRWSGAPTPPALIELWLRWPEGGPSWPALAVAPRLGGRAP